MGLSPQPRAATALPTLRPNKFNLPRQMAGRRAPPAEIVAVGLNIGQLRPGVSVEWQPSYGSDGHPDLQRECRVLECATAAIGILLAANRHVLNNAC
jgi:hypothetical protein